MMSREMKRKKRITTAVEVLILAAMAFITITPIYWGIVTSLKNTNEIAAYPPKVIGFAVTWSHYARILSSGYFKCVLNSALYSIAAITMGLGFGYLAAYGFERRNFPMKKILFYLVVIGIPLSTGSSVLLIPNYLLMMKFGLANHWYTMPLIYTAYNLPLCIWMMISGIRGLPYEIEEAAKIDGCDEKKTTRYITLPMMAGTFTICFFLAITRAFVTYDVNISLTEGGPFGSTTLAAMYVYNMAFSSKKYGLGQAEALILFLVIAVIAVTQAFIGKSKEVEA